MNFDEFGGWGGGQRSNKTEEKEGCPRQGSVCTDVCKEVLLDLLQWPV